MGLKSWKMLVVITILSLVLSFVETDNEETHSLAERKKKPRNNHHKEKHRRGPEKYCSTMKGSFVPEDESGWPRQCHGRQQSPINIETKKAKAVTRPKLVLTGVNQIITSLTITNEHGQAVQVKPSYLAAPILLSKGVLGKAVYELRQFHFHWTCSEHAIDGDKVPLEVHFVFAKRGMRSRKAVKTPGSVVVLSTLYEVGKRRNKFMQPMMEALESNSLGKPNSTVIVMGRFRLRDYLPKHVGTYYTYMGSLTTPPCTEHTRFIIFANHSSLSLDQLHDFTRIREQSGRHVTHNWRRLEPLNGRTVMKVTTRH